MLLAQEFDWCWLFDSFVLTISGGDVPVTASFDVLMNRLGNKAVRK